MRARQGTSEYDASERFRTLIRQKTALFYDENSAFNIYHSPRGLVPSPIMVAYWGEPALRDPGSNGFAFEISSVTGELLEMNVGNASTCKGLPLIKDIKKLLAISDEEFLKMSPLEKSNLVVQFATVDYPALDKQLPATTNIAPPSFQNQNPPTNQTVGPASP